MIIFTLLVDRIFNFLNSCSKIYLITFNLLLEKSGILSFHHYVLSVFMKSY